MKYLPNAVSYTPGKPRCFVAFEDRGRDLSGLLEYGTVVQLFPSHLSWQLTSARTEEFLAAVSGFFQAHEFLDTDYVVAVGDPVVIALMTAAAARENGGRVKLLKWDRLPCERCGKYRATCGDELCPRDVRGRYLEVAVRLPWSQPR